MAWRKRVGANRKSFDISKLFSDTSKNVFSLSFTLSVFPPRLVECQSPMWMILRPSQPWPEDLFSTTSPSISPSGAPPLRGLHAYHIFQVYKKTGRGGGYFKRQKKDSSHTSHTTRGLKFYLILPVLKENKDKKGGKKDLLLHWSFVFRNMKAGMFSFFFFRDYAYFFVLLEFMHFCN